MHSATAGSLLRPRPHLPSLPLLYNITITLFFFSLLTSTPHTRSGIESYFLLPRLLFLLLLLLFLVSSDKAPLSRTLLFCRIETRPSLLFSLTIATITDAVTHLTCRLPPHQRHRLCRLLLLLPFRSVARSSAPHSPRFWRRCMPAQTKKCSDKVEVEAGPSPVLHAQRGLRDGKPPPPPTPPIISKRRRFKGRDVTVLHAGAGLSTSLRSALAVPGGQLKSYLGRKNEAEIERLVEERVRERMREAEKVWVRECLDQDTPMGVELARAVEGEVVKRVGETDWGRKMRLQRRQYEVSYSFFMFWCFGPDLGSQEMLGARNEEVRRYTDFVGNMETVYYQYGGKEDRELNGK